MKHLKKYEGFLDFFSKKNKNVEKLSNITLDDIYNCITDIFDETRIKNSINHSIDGIFTNDDYITGKDFHNVKGFKISDDKRILSFQIQYLTGQISDDEAEEIILSCKGHLESIGCKMTMFIGCGRDEGWSSDTEYSDFKKMISKNVADRSLRNIVIKVTLPEQIEESFDMRRELCDRCNKPTGGTTIMSMFNDDVICMDCKEEEKKDPEYSAASKAESDAVKRGVKNYPGAIPDYKPLK